MTIRTLTLGILGLFVSLSSLAADPGVWYVDDDNYGKGGTGTESNPFGTIQEAIDAASAGDIIRVAEGVYDKGERTGQKKAAFNQRTRVVVDRKLTILGAGRGKTFIVGEIGDGVDDKDGTKTVQCVWIADEASGTVIDGFTLCNGAACSGTNGDAGGAIASEGPEYEYTLAYCTVSNCVSKYAAMRNGTAVATLFVENGASDATYSDAYASKLYNCILTRGRSNYSAYNCGPVVNCTVVNNAGRGLAVKDAATVVEGGTGCYWNTANYGNATEFSNAASVGDTCFIDGTNYDKDKSVNVTVARQAYDSHTNLVMSGVLGDFRPIAGGRLDGTGKRSALSMDFIPEAYRNLDFNRKPIASDAPVPIGALLPAVTPATAGIQFVNPLKVNGIGCTARFQCHYSDRWPTQICVEDPEEDESFLGVRLGAVISKGTATGNYDGAAYNYRYRGTYDSVWVTLPPTVNASGERLYELGVERLRATETLWVDCEKTGEYVEDGSEDAPFRTLQAAIDVIAGQKAFALIKVKRGHYATGGRADGDTSTGGPHNARVVIPSDTLGMMLAVDGPESTFIEGEADPDTLDAQTGVPGCGPKAYRCLSAPSTVYFAVAGFTLCKGYTSNAGQNAGGAVRGNGGKCPHVMDCVLTDNHAFSHGKCAYQARLLRCLITNNLDNVSAVASYGYMASCIICGNAPTNEDSDVTCPLNKNTLHNVTVYEPMATKGMSVNHKEVSLFNSVIACGGTLNAVNANGIMAGNVADGLLGTSGTFQDEMVRFENPMLAAPGRGDFRPLRTSPVVGAAAPTNASVTTGEMLLNGFGSDFGNRRLILEDGRMVAGAVSELRDPSVVYVDATKGSDANDGLTEAKAKQSLKAVMEDAVRAGDTVVALPGTYRTGTMGYMSRPYYIESAGHPAFLQARVTVPAGVTLIAKGDVSETVIEGEEDAESGDTYKRGPNAVRCVFLEAGASVRGFTLRGGRTNTKDNIGGNYDDAIGGGVYGRADANAWMTDCVISNCAATYGGALGNVSANRCRFIGDMADNGTCAQRGNLYNSLVDKCRGSTIFYMPKTIVNCTLGYNRTTGTSYEYLCRYAGDDTVVRNLLMLAKPHGSTSATYDFSAAAEVSGFYGPKEAFTLGFPAGATGIVTNEYELAQLTAFYADDCSPLDKTAPTIDRGVATAGCGDVDLAGTERVLNAQIDFGAYEFDWKNEYAATMGKPGVKVVAVTEGVKLADGHAVLSDGDALALDCPAGKVGVAKLVLTGTGTVKAYLNGVLVGTLTESGELKVDSGLDVDRLVFAYEGTGSAYVAKLSSGLGMLMILR